MNSSECYQRAAQDAAYRQSLLQELRLVKYVSLGLIWLCVLVAVGFAVYGGVEGARVDNIMGVMIVAAFSWIPYLWCTSRISALRTLDSQLQVEVSPNPGDFGMTSH